MGYFFERNEPVPMAIRRILAELFDEATTELNPENKGICSGIHNTRKCFKKIRCLLYLVSGELGKDFYQEKDDLFRDMGRQLAMIRDAEAIIEAYDKLDIPPVEKQRGITAGTNSVRTALVQRLNDIGVKQLEVKDAELHLSQELKALRLNLEHWPIHYVDFTSIAAHYKRNYRQGKQCLKQAYQTPTDKHFHLWRKRTKAFGYHSRLLRECCPPVMDHRIAMSKTLEDLLGQDHDLAVLRSILKHKNPRVAQEPFFVGRIDKKACKVTRHQAKKQQLDLRKKAHVIGKELYQPSPAKLYQDTLNQWQSWQKALTSTLSTDKKQPAK